MPVTAAVIAAVADRVIAAARYVQEHNAVASNAVENFRLTKGNDRVIVPKVGQFTMQTLVDGQDIVEEQALGLSTVTLTAAEVGGKVVITDKSVRENGTTDIFRMIGRQFGDASARRMDTDVIALFTNLNGGTTFGAAAATFTLGNFAGAIARAKGRTTNPFVPTIAIQHPHAALAYMRSATVAGVSTSRPANINDQDERTMLRNFWKHTLNGVDLFEDGNITPDSSDDAIGVITQTDALYKLMSKDWGTERERDASRRAWEVVYSADYGVGELDDTKGAPLTYDAATPNDTA